MRTQPNSKPIVRTRTTFFPRVRTRCAGASASSRRGEASAARKVLFNFPTTQSATMETRVMNRLPGPEPKSRGQETAVFASLALAGLAAIAVALSSSVNFVGGSDEVHGRGQG